MTKLWVAALALTALAACTPTGAPAAGPSSGPAASPAVPSPGVSASEPAVSAPTASGRPPFESTPPWSSAAGQQVPVSETRLTAIRADLARRGVSAAGLAIVTSVATTWNDSSLGCPTPGRTYTQALVNGQRVVVEVGNVRYDYRFGSDDDPLLCPGR